MGSSCSTRKLHMLESDGHKSSSWWVQSGKLMYQEEGEERMKQAKSLRVTICQGYRKVVTTGTSNEHDEFHLSNGDWFDLKQLVGSSSASIDELPASPVKPGCLTCLGQVVITTSRDLGEWESVNGHFWYEKRATHERILPDLPEKSSWNTPKTIDGVDQIVDPDIYNIHFSFPRNVQRREKYSMVDSRTTDQTTASNVETDADVQVGLTQVKVGGGLSQNNAIQQAISAGTGKLVVEYYEPKAVFEWPPGTEVPQDHLGKEFIRCIIVGAEAKATISFSKGQDQGFAETGNSVNMHVQADPALLMGGFGTGGGLGGGFSAKQKNKSTQGPVAVDVEMQGGFGSGAILYKGQPLDKVLKELSLKFQRMVANCETWTVLCIETCSNDIAKEKENEVIMMVGNPGTGKSTLMNCYAMKSLFKSGVTKISGMTYQLDEKVHRGRRFLDTPGLNDARKREQAAQAITEALKKEGRYRLFFVMGLRNGRVLPEDTTTMKTVLEATKGELKDNSFGVIFNQVTAAEMKLLEDDMSQTLDEYREVLFDSKDLPSTRHIFFNPMNKKLEGQSNFFEALPDKVHIFLSCIKGVQIKKEKVQAIDVTDWDNRINIEQKLAAEVQQRVQQEIEEEKIRVQNQNAEELARMKREQNVEFERMQQEHQQDLQRVQQHWSEEGRKAEELEEKLQEMDRKLKQSQDAMRKVQETFSIPELFLAGLEDKSGSDVELLLKNATNVVRSNKSCVLAAVKRCGWALRYAADSLQNDKQVVLEAIAGDGAVLEIVADHFKYDKDVVMIAVTTCGVALKFARGGLNQDNDCLKAAGFWDTTLPEGAPYIAVLSVLFSLGSDCSMYASEFALAMRRDPFLKTIKAYNPNVNSKNYCGHDSNYTCQDNPCMGTLDTCNFTHQKNVTRVAGKEEVTTTSCWRFAYRWHLELAKENGGYMIQVQEPHKGLGDGQMIETKMAKQVGVKVFRTMADHARWNLNKIEKLSGAIKKWKDNGCTNMALEEVYIGGD